MPKEVGFVECITGTMFAGKSTELIRRLKRMVIAEQHVLVFKCSTDTRSPTGRIKTYDGYELPAFEIPASGPRILLDVVREHERKGENIVAVGLDEAQFFSHGSPMVEILTLLRSEGKRVIVSGLDINYRAEPFGMMPQILTIADRVDKLLSICAKCKNEFARYPQRLIDGKPAPSDAPEILVGSTDFYEARCVACYEKPVLSAQQLPIQLMSASNC